MEDFFAAFPGFVHSLNESPEKNFCRLQNTQEWSDLEYLTFRRQFLDALVESTQSPVHRFFVTEHPDFLTYASDMPPRSEFERLRIFKNWTSDGLFADSKALFETAFHAEFSTALDTYFASCPDDFLYNPRRAPMVEFNRLMRRNKWKRGDDRHRRAQTSFFAAFIVDFDSYFGGDENDITTWQELCEVLGVDPIPEAMTKCQKVSNLLPTSLRTTNLLLMWMGSATAQCQYPRSSPA